MERLTCFRLSVLVPSELRCGPCLLPQPAWHEPSGVSHILLLVLVFVLPHPQPSVGFSSHTWSSGPEAALPRRQAPQGHQWAGGDGEDLCQSEYSNTSTYSMCHRPVSTGCHLLEGGWCCNKIHMKKTDAVKCSASSDLLWSQADFYFIFLSLPGPELLNRMLPNTSAEGELPYTGWGTRLKKKKKNIFNVVSVRLTLSVCVSWTFCLETSGRWWSSRWNSCERSKMESDWCRTWTGWKGWSSSRWEDMQ